MISSGTRRQSLGCRCPGIAIRSSAIWRAGRRQGWVSEAGASAIRADLELAQIGVRRGFHLCRAGCRAVRLRDHELRGRALDGHVEARPSGAAAGARCGAATGARPTCSSASSTPSPTPPCSGGIAVFGASIMLIAQMYHMEGNPPDAVLTWALGALLAAVAAAIQPGARRHVRAAGRMDLHGARVQRVGALGLPACRGRRRRRRRPGSAGARACISPPSASWCGWCRSATSCSTTTRTGSWRSSESSWPVSPPPAPRRSMRVSRPPPRSSPTA